MVVLYHLCVFINLEITASLQKIQMSIFISIKVRDSVDFKGSSTLKVNIAENAQNI